MNYIVQMIKLLLIPLILCFALLPSYSAVKGGIDYNIPIDYTKLNQTELETRAEFYYNSVLKEKKLNEDMTSALTLYSILTNAYPENRTYAIRLGKLYDTLGKNRYAKGLYNRAMGIDHAHPEPYFYLGEYYYSRDQYRKALKYYLKAYDNGYSEHYPTLERLGTIYQKFGDTEKALQYLQCASTISPNENLDKKINSVKSSDNTNKVYYK